MLLLALGNFSFACTLALSLSLPCLAVKAVSDQISSHAQHSSLQRRGFLGNMQLWRRGQKEKTRKEQARLRIETEHLDKGELYRVKDNFIYNTDRK